MSKICQITGKKAMIGNNVSKSKRRTKRSFAGFSFASVLLVFALSIRLALTLR